MDPAGPAGSALAFVATAPRGLTALLADELRALGAAQVHERATAVSFTGPLEIGYRACLWSRVASRILLPLRAFPAGDAEAFYRQALAFDWAAHIDPAASLACEFTGTLPGITNTHYGALRLKDAICDALRERTGRRPDIDPADAAQRVHAHGHAGEVSLALDLAGAPLSHRGYRLDSAVAPLRENLAAGVLLRAGWPALAAAGGEFLDPLCGSGTLVIEAAMIAADQAPQLRRSRFAFQAWRQHDAALWERLRAEAQARVRAPLGPISGTDIDAHVLVAARTNAERAGVAERVHFERRPVADARARTRGPGLVCTNPPYGERLGDASSAEAAHAALGTVLREHFAGFEAAILTAAPQPLRALRLRSYREHEFWNGPIRCRLLRIDLAAPGAADPSERREARRAAAAASPGAQMFANRLRKNLARLAREAARAEVSCYRLYDADMPEYAFAIDRYATLEGTVHLHVQEYAAPAEIEAEAVRRRREEVLATLPEVTGVASEHVHVRVRQRQRGSAQYERREAAEDDPLARALTVAEGGLRLLVNLDDYLDTGLFLDHRLTRARLRAALAPGQRCLNLFCYTASASVYAAAAGARTVSVDLSNRYLDWAAANFRLNAMSEQAHRLVRADCRAWLAEAPPEPFDVIFLDPPTFSNSKRMDGVLDVQRDHAELIEQCLRRLTPAGLLLFSTNAQRFTLDPALAARHDVRDVSRATLPFDFARNPRIHRCFEVRARPA